MPTLTPTQRKAYDAFEALWKTHDIPRTRAIEILKDLFGYTEIPYFMNLDVPDAERIIQELEPKRLLKTLKYVGQKTGVCQLCGRELTDPESVKRGIGPICGGKLEIFTSVEDL